MLVNHANNNFSKHIAIIGGGRWARIVAGVLSNIAPPGTRLSLCSPGHSAGWEEWLKGCDKSGKCRYSIAPELDILLDDDTLDLAMIIRAARDNSATAIAALNAGKSVFVEKPFALNLKEATAVVASAEGQFCTTGLVFLFASNLHQFATATRRLGQLKEIAIEWHDPRGEQRYNEAKSYDASLNCLLDVLPHIWSILRLIAPDADLASGGASAFAGGRKVGLNLNLGGAIVTVTLARDAEARCRTLAVKGARGEAAIDFTEEPGSAVLNGRALDVGKGFSSPLARELDTVARNFSGPFSTPLCRVEHAIQSIALAAALLPGIRRDQYRQIGLGLGANASAGDRKDADYALRELVMDLMWNKQPGKAIKRKPNPATSESWEIVRDWLLGATTDSQVSPCIKNDPQFLALKQQLEGC